MTTTAARTTRKGFTLSEPWREFWKHPSPWMIGATPHRGADRTNHHRRLADHRRAGPRGDAGGLPVLRWIVHVFILHWRPRHIGALTIDPLLAREHRKHHVNPRSIPLIFIPAKALVWVLPLAVAIALLAFPRLGLGLTYLVFVTVLVLVYEWIHYLIHSDYKPKSGVYKAIWRNHRQHHFKNEHYWYTVTSSGTADRVLGTYPDPAAVPTSPTAKNLHASGV